MWWIMAFMSAIKYLHSSYHRGSCAKTSRDYRGNSSTVADCLVMYLCAWMENVLLDDGRTF